MSTPEGEDRTDQTTPKYRLERGSEDYDLFHNLIETVPDFLALTATKVKQRFQQFQGYPTGIINTALQNAHRAQKTKKKTGKKAAGKEKDDGKEELTEEEKSEFKFATCRR